MAHFSGVHSLLQPDERREAIQDETSNFAEEISREAGHPEGVVEANANNADEVDSGAGGSQTARSLCLLRSDRQPPGLMRFYREATKLLYKWLNRRSQRRSYQWAEFKQLLQRFPLPLPRVRVHLFYRSPNDYLGSRVR